MILTKLANIFGNRSRRTAPPTRRVLLHIEHLERRDLLAAAPHVVAPLPTPTPALQPALVSTFAPRSVSLAALSSIRLFYINTAHTISVAFDAGVPVTFRSDGSVSSGTLVGNTLLAIDTAHRVAVSFKAGTSVNFNDDGSVSSGTMAANTLLAIDTAHSVTASF